MFGFLKETLSAVAAILFMAVLVIKKFWVTALLFLVVGTGLVTGIATLLGASLATAFKLATAAVCALGTLIAAGRALVEFTRPSSWF